VDKDKNYLGNINLKGKGSHAGWTEEQIKEFLKCSEDPIYFSEKYIKIVHVDHGFIPIKLYDYQKEIIEKITNNRKLVTTASRQCGKCVINTTEIKLRNKKTGEVIKTTVEDFFNAEKTK